MSKTKSELQEELVKLEIQLRDVKRERKDTMTDFKDRTKDINNQIEMVLKELGEIKG